MVLRRGPRGRKGRRWDQCKGAVGRLGDRPRLFRFWAGFFLGDLVPYGVKFFLQVPGLQRPLRNSAAAAWESFPRPITST